MRKSAAIANVDFAVTWLHSAVDVCERIFLRHGVTLLQLPERGRGRPRYSRPGGRRYSLLFLFLIRPLGAGQDFFGYQ